MSERTDTKLRETKFFLQNLVRESDKESPSEPEAFLFYLGFVTLSAFSCGECSGQQASCGGGCPGPSAE